MLFHRLQQIPLLQEGETTVCESVDVRPMVRGVIQFYMLGKIIIGLHLGFFWAALVLTVRS